MSKISPLMLYCSFHIDVSQSKTPATQDRNSKTRTEYKLEATTSAFRTAISTTKETGIFAINVPNTFY